MKKTKQLTDDAWIKTDSDELGHLITRIEATSLSAVDKKLIASMITTVVTLRLLLERRTGRLMTILRKIFGLKTESTAKSGRRPEKKPTGEDQKGRGKGNGRNGKNDFPGANKISVPHECLKAGDPCPACNEAKLSQTSDSTAYRWTGHPPLLLTIYSLARFLCHACKATFTAAVPGEKLDTSKLDPSAHELSGTVKERDFAPTVGAQIASFRFEMGVPHYRLAEIQNQQGVPFAPSSQYKVMDDAMRKPAMAVFSELERLAGSDGEIFINDDTNARVMDLEQAVKRSKEAAKAVANDAAVNSITGFTQEKLGKSSNSDKKNESSKKIRPRQKIQTSAIVTHLGEQTICLYFTGHKNAGENLAHVLDHRGQDAPIPLQMCDALPANRPGTFVTILGNCLDHARRKYNDVKASFPEEVNYVLEKLGQVYHFDQEAKDLDLSPEERLAWHQKKSAPIMAELKNWAVSGLAEKRIEPNSTL